MMYVWTFSGVSETALVHGLLVTNPIWFHFEIRMPVCTSCISNVQTTQTCKCQQCTCICANMCQASMQKPCQRFILHHHVLELSIKVPCPHTHTCNMEGISCHFILAVVPSAGLINIIDQKDFLDFTNIIFILFDDICKVQTSLISLFYMAESSDITRVVMFVHIMYKCQWFCVAITQLHYILDLIL